MKVKRQLTGWEKTLANHITDKGLVFRIYKDLQQQESNLTKKWVKDIHRQFSKGEIQRVQSCPPKGEWTKKMWYMYAMGYYTATKRMHSCLFAAKWMQLETTMLNEISCATKHKCHVFSALWYLKYTCVITFHCGVCISRQLELKVKQDTYSTILVGIPTLA